MKSKLKTELELLGVRVTNNQVNNIKKIAVTEHRMEQRLPMFKHDRRAYYIVLLMSFVRSVNEICYFIQDNELRFKLKRDFLLLKKHTRELYEEFERINKNNQELLVAYRSYSDDIMEMVYKHLDIINSNDKYDR